MKSLIYLTIVWAWSRTLRPVIAQGGNTTCLRNTLDWYTSVAGETPCSTYQRLRRICNPSYTLGALSTFTPGDNCDEQLADCCCNSISFALSMLCLNCQQGVGSGVNGDTGYDAGKGAYQMYLTKASGITCQPNVNQSFPVGIQAAVCNEKIKIYDDLYTLFWTAGDWYYEYTRQAISKDQAQFANNTFTHCASTTNNSSSLAFSATSVSSSSRSPTSFTSSTSSTSPALSPSSLSGGAIAGIAVGAAAFLLLVGVVLWFLRKRSKRELHPDFEIDVPNMDVAFPIEPFTLSQEGRPLPVQDVSSNTYPAPHSRTPLGSAASVTSPWQASSRKGLTNNGSELWQSSTSSVPLLERHTDAGAVTLDRSPSGRLPPAYGEQLGANNR